MYYYNGMAKVAKKSLSKVNTSYYLNIFNEIYVVKVKLLKNIKHLNKVV